MGILAKIKQMWRCMVDDSWYKNGVVVGIRGGVPCAAAGAGLKSVGREDGFAKIPHNRTNIVSSSSYKSV